MRATGRAAARDATGVAMGEDPIGRFLRATFALEPVTATFTGVHDFDDELPDWSPDGLARAADEMRSLRHELATIGVAADGSTPADLADADRTLADAHLEIRIAEQAGRHFHRGNPALWTGEAAFSVLALALRDFAPVGERMAAAAARLRALPRFFAHAAASLAGEPLREAWIERACRECEGAALFCAHGVDRWLHDEPARDPQATELRAAARVGQSAFEDFARTLRAMPSADAARYDCGDELLDLLVRRGHWCATPWRDLLVEARDELEAADARLHALMHAEAPGGWLEVQERIAADHPSPEEYLDSFAHEWTACRALAESRDVVSWPVEAPVRFVPIPELAREAAPSLYFLNYRSPAPFDRLPVHEHFVPALPIDAIDAERVLRATNRSVIRLNHVVHHAALGHHVQNHHAMLGRSRVGRVAGVDGASRLAMFGAGTMAEGWACYAVDLMEELGALAPLERVAEQQTRVRMLCRAVVDLSLHGDRMSFDEAATLYASRAGMPTASARAEVVKNSMFPGAAVMYWLGTREIHRLRGAREHAEGARFSLRAFHDELLSHGAMPVAMAAAMMNRSRAA